MSPARYAVLGLALTFLAATADVASAQGRGNGPPGPSLPVAVAGAADDGSTFAGTLNIRRFERSGDAVNAVGTITGVLTRADGSTRNIATLAEVPVDLENSGPTDTASGSAVVIQQLACEILDLRLGPLDLNLLGLVVHLDPIVLTIDAQPGAGYLLGNMLCSLAGLIDPLGGLQQIVNLLNQILALLG